eukprot:c52211_g1_i1.p1 GENE.c52211_g1_i1~~c52211_g1_i1.p1  ORF type:complete len:270 (+),score=35.44 c52211_g1_i1:1-810(+)
MGVESSVEMRSWGCALVLLILHSEIITVEATVAHYDALKTMVQFATTARELAQLFRPLRQALEVMDSSTKQKTSEPEKGKITRGDSLEAIQHIQLEWRGVEDNPVEEGAEEDESYYHKLTVALLGKPGDQGSVPLDEAHSVPAMMNLWLALFLYACAKNVSYSNPLASDVEPPTSAEMRRESFLLSSSKPLPTFEEGNSSTRTSSLSGNFLMGFAFFSLLLAIWFAPPAIRAKLLAGALVALGAANTIPTADAATDETRFIAQPDVATL